MVLVGECYHVRLITVGDWPVQDKTCSRNQLLTGGEGGELLYVRMNVNYNQCLQGGLLKATSVLA